MRTLLLTAVATAALLATWLPAQTAATTVNSGVSCAPAGQPAPDILAVNKPVIGTNFTVRYRGQNGGTNHSATQPVLLTGLQKWSAPVPTSIFPNQPSGCFVQVSPEFIVNMPPKDAVSWEINFTVRIPKNSSLIGAVYYQQFMGITRSQFQGNIITAVGLGNRLEITIGI